MKQRTLAPGAGVETTNKVNSISQWRTLVLVNFSWITKVHALSFPNTLFSVPPPVLWFNGIIS